MNRKTLIALSVGAAFALPLTASAGGDKAASGATQNSGAEQMFKALDKNKDGFVSRDEAKGTPHAKDFDKLDKNHDGKLSRAEHAAAQEHANEKAASGSTSNKRY
jgi:EF hand domain-containing protein